MHPDRVRMMLDVRCMLMHPEGEGEQPVRRAGVLECGSFQVYNIYISIYISIYIYIYSLGQALLAIKSRIGPHF